MVVKRFFREPTKAQIKALDCSEAKKDLVDRILALDEGQGLIIARTLVPPAYRNSWHFLRHGDRVPLRGSIDVDPERAPREATPVDYRIRAFHALKERMGAYSGYEYHPIDIRPHAPVDARIRRISLVECLEGARIFAYTHQVPMASIDVEQYTNAGAVAKDGATFPVKVPSRQKGSRRYSFSMVSVPLANNSHKFRISWGSLSRGHNCKRSQYMGLRYSAKEDSEVFNWCAHEVSAYLQIMALQRKNDNRIPLQMSQIALPTPATKDFYKRLCDSVLLQDPSIESRDRLRVLNKAEQEILLWGLVYKKDHHTSFFAKDHLGKYDWALRHTPTE